MGFFDFLMDPSVSQTPRQADGSNSIYNYDRGYRESMNAQKAQEQDLLNRVFSGDPAAADTIVRHRLNSVGGDPSRLQGDTLFQHAMKVLQSAQAPQGPPPGLLGR